MQLPKISLRQLAWIMILCGCLGIGAVGCGKGGKGSSANAEAAMATADPAVKAKWDTAMAAAKSNEYAGAILILKSLAEDPKLTPTQQEAVKNTMGAVSDKMYDALNKGDAKAQQAIEELRKSSGR